jgi:hypothetical protein
VIRLSASFEETLRTLPHLHLTRTAMIRRLTETTILSHPLESG